MSIASSKGNKRGLVASAMQNRCSSNFAATACLASSLCLIALDLSAAEQWLNFQSTQHFSIEVPADWDHGALQGDALGMYDVKTDGKKAILIPDGHAYISAGSDRDTPAEAIADAKRFEIEISQVKKLPVSRQARGCQSLTEVDEREWTRYAEDLRKPRSAHAFIQNSVTYYCEAPDRKPVNVSVNFWEGDPRERLYRDIVQHMATSIRFMP